MPADPLYTLGEHAASIRYLTESQQRLEQGQQRMEAALTNIDQKLAVRQGERRVLAMVAGGAGGFIAAVAPFVMRFFKAE